MTRSLLAISDLHVRHPRNRDLVDDLHPHHPDDWLVVVGDVSELFADVVQTLELLSARFRRVIWTPGNHELWTLPDDPEQARGVARYDLLVEAARSLDVLTPEDDFAVWEGIEGPLTVAPVLTLYDHTWRRDPSHGRDEALQAARESGVVCTDVFHLHPDPYPDVDAWCRDRVTLTHRRLTRAEAPLVVAGHYPLVREPTRVLRYPDFALWCGTELTTSWHRHLDVAEVLYGHLHIPRTTWSDGVRFREVSVGYPREWESRPAQPGPTTVRRG